MDQTSLGFFDLAIAAPSMKAALEAWGADSNLFHQGAAKQSDDPPAALEVVRFHLKNSTGRVAAGVVDREIHVGARVREERGDVRVPGRIRDEGRSFASGSLDVRYDGTQRGRRTSRRDNVQSLLGETLAKLRAQPPIRADADVTAFCMEILRSVPTRTVRRRAIRMKSDRAQGILRPRCAPAAPGPGQRRYSRRASRRLGRRGRPASRRPSPRRAGSARRATRGASPSGDPR